MAARKRDHAAEYARRKAKAQSLGYPSVYQARKARKAVGVTRRQPTPTFTEVIKAVPGFGSSTAIRRMRSEAKAWSKKHSHSRRSKYKASMTDAEVKAFWKAYVEEYEELGTSRRKRARERRKRIAEYVVEYHDVGEEEWEQKYPLSSA